MEFIQEYKKYSPVSMGDSTMNKLCWVIEEHFMNMKIKYNIAEFNSDLLKSPNVTYSTVLFNKVVKLKEEYDKTVKASIEASRKTRSTSYDKQECLEQQRLMFKEQALLLCSNEETLCNILVDLCYKNSNKSKQFAWELCGEQMVNNLLSYHNNKLSFPMKNEEGDILFKGKRFKMEEIVL